MKPLRYTVIKNAVANLVRGGAGAVVAFALPPILTRFLEPERFSAWALLLQIAAYIGFLDFGIQTAVSRFVAQAVERNSDTERNSYINTAFFLLICVSIFAFVVVCGVAYVLPHIYKQIPSYLLSELRRGLVLLALLSALALPTSTFTGVLVGLQRNEIPAIVVGGSKLAGAAVVVWALFHTNSLVVMAGLVGGTNLFGGVLQYFIVGRVLNSMRISPAFISKYSIRTLSHFCAGLSVWSFAGFLVGGLDLAVVGYFQFSGIGPYSVAANVVLIISGIGGAVTSALIAPAAALHARGESGRLGSVILRATRYLAQILVVCSLPFFLGGHYLLRLWVGPIYAQASIHILEILLAANVIRLLGAPYAAALIGAGQHIAVVGSPLFEGFINLAVSIVGGYYYGSIGVAFGTLIGGIAGMAWQLLWNVPRICAIQLGTAELFGHGIILPISELLPGIIGIVTATFLTQAGMPLRVAIALVGTAVSIVYQLLRHRRTRGVIATRDSIRLQH